MSTRKGHRSLWTYDVHMTTSGISQADIARRAGVSRAAVGNWRTRYADFPQPNGGTRRSPTFDSDTVDRWLAGHLTGVGIQVVAPQPIEAAGSPPPLAKPLLNLLRRAHARKPGMWLLHEEIVDNGVATAYLIRRLAATGDVQRARVAFPGGTRVLVRIPHAEDIVDTRDIERQANAALAAVGHHVAIHPAKDTAGGYTSTRFLYRGIRYTGYSQTCSWTVTLAGTPQREATGAARLPRAELSRRRTDEAKGARRG